MYPETFFSRSSHVTCSFRPFWSNPNPFYQQKNQLSRPDSKPSTHHPQEPQPRPTTFGSMVVPPKWTPPLSPSSKSTKHSSSSFSSFSAGEENRPLSPRGALKVLNSPGVPPVDDLRRMRVLVGAASRAWLRDFLIRGGRCVL